MSQSGGGGMFSRMFSGQNQGGQQSSNGGGAGEQNQERQHSGAGQEEQEEESQYAPLASLFAEDEVEDEEDDDSSPPNQNNQNNQNNQQQTPEQQLAAEIQGMLKGFTITQDDFGENFDPSDPASFAQAMTAVQRKTAVATMQMAFKPMQQALNQMSKDIRTEIQSSLNEFGRGNTAKQTLAEIVPEVNDPELSGLVNSLFAQAQKKNPKNPKAAADGVRKALDAMGLQPQKSKRNSNDPSEGASRREGREALDLYGPLPTRR